MNNMLSLLTNFTLEEYGVIGIVLLTLFGIVQKQITFSNKMASDHAKQREEDLDKISAALIIIKEGQEQQTKMAEKVTESAQKISENQNLLAQDMKTIKDIVIQKLPDIKQS